MTRTGWANRLPAKHRPTKYLVSLLLLCLAACGTTVVMIRVDIMSFLSDNSIITDYGDNPPIPGSGPTVRIRTPAEIVALPDEIQTVSEIRAVEITVVIAFHNDTGEASLSYEIYLHDEEANIFDTPAIVDQTVDLSPGSNSTQEVVIEGDERVLSLFNGSEIAVAAEVLVAPGGGTENISGRAEVRDFTAMITATGERQ